MIYSTNTIINGFNFFYISVKSIKKLFIFKSYIFNCKQTNEENDIRTRQEREIKKTEYNLNWDLKWIYIVEEIEIYKE
jgi:hypothetical protein